MRTFEVFVLVVLVSSFFGVRSKAQTEYRFCGEQKFEVDGQTVFTILEDMPKYEGGEEALAEYIESSIKWSEIPTPVEDRFTSYVSYIVDTQGKVIKPCIVESSRHPETIVQYDTIAVDIVKTLEYSPGYLRGRPVHVLYTVPVRFDRKRILKAKKKADRN